MNTNPRSRGECIPGGIAVDVQNVCRVARSTGVHYVRGVLTDTVADRRAHRDTGLDDRVQTILPIAHAAFVSSLIVSPRAATRRAK